MVNEQQRSGNEEVISIRSVQEVLDLGKKFLSHLKLISLTDLGEDLISLLLKCKDAVALPEDALGKSRLLKHQIRLKSGTQHIYITTYGLRYSKLLTVDKLIDEMLPQDVIESSYCEWNCPLILVPKANGIMCQ